MNLRTAAPALGLWALLAGCRGAPQPQPEGVLQLTLNTPDASVFIDEQPVVSKPGSTAIKVKVPAGSRRIEVRAPGRFTVYRETLVPAAGERRLDIALRPDPDADSRDAPPAAAPGQLGQIERAGARHIVNNTGKTDPRQDSWNRWTPIAATPTFCSGW